MKPYPTCVLSSVSHKTVFSVDPSEWEWHESVISQYHTASEPERSKLEIMPNMSSMEAGSKIKPILEFVTHRVCSRLPSGMLLVHVWPSHLMSQRARHAARRKQLTMYNAQTIVYDRTKKYRTSFCGTQPLGSHECIQLRPIVEFDTNLLQRLIAKRVEHIFCVYGLNIESAFDQVITDFDKRLLCFSQLKEHTHTHTHLQAPTLANA